MGVKVYNKSNIYPHKLRIRMRIYKRELYLSRLRGFYNDTGMIKVLTGVRRCGKSCILQSVISELKENGVTDAALIDLNLDKREFRKIKTADQLESLIEQHSSVPGIKYLFIDEVQNVHEFEGVINAYREEGDWSIFITGSNSYLLSGQLTTKLTGRYINIEVFTLTFAEYLGMKKMLAKPIDPNLETEFNNYLSEGGFPKTVEYDNIVDKHMYTTSVIDEIFEKDIRRHQKIKHVSVFDRVMEFMIGNFGSTVSITNLLEHFAKHEKIKIKRETLNRYIQILVDAKILYRCKRFDIKSKRALSGDQKYYLADLSFYGAISVDGRINYGPTLENVTYVYARSMGYAASVGKIGSFECDFILRNPSQDYAYVQVSRSIMDESTEEREYRALEAIRDYYPKYLLTMDGLFQKRNGITHANIAQFMSEENLFN